MYKDSLKKIASMHKEARKDLELWADGRKSDGNIWDEYQELCEGIVDNMKKSHKNYEITFTDGEALIANSDSLWIENSDCFRGITSENYIFGHAFYAIEKIEELKNAK